MAMNPLGDWDGGDHAVTLDDEVALSLDDTELALPLMPRLCRCGSLRDVGTGPWIGTLVCCTRPVDHAGDHTMSLGDLASPSYWRETWA
jgi:hypothetical protein